MKLDRCFDPLIEAIVWPTVLSTGVVLRDITEIQQEAMDLRFSETMDLQGMVARHADPDNPVRYDPEPTFSRAQPSPKFFHARVTHRRTIYHGGRQKRFSKV